MNTTTLQKNIELYNALPDKHSIREKRYAQLLPNGRSLKYDVSANPVQSAVLLTLLTRKNEITSIVFIERTEDNRVHSGQAAFPGGKFDAKAGDKSLKDTALRETYEEVGISSEKITVIGELSELYIPPSNFLVQPFVGFITEPPVYKQNFDEVKAIIEIPFDELFIHGILSSSLFKTFIGEIEAPCFNFDKLKVWGATAMILNEFVYILKL